MQTPPTYTKEECIATGIRFFKRADFNNLLNEEQVASTAYIELKDGTPADEETRSAINQKSREFWNDLAAAGDFPASFRHATHTQLTAYRNLLENTFKFLARCEYHWKSDKVWMDNYGSWLRTAKKNSTDGAPKSRSKKRKAPSTGSVSPAQKARLLAPEEDEVQIPSTPITAHSVSPSRSPSLSAPEETTSAPLQVSARCIATTSISDSYIDGEHSVCHGGSDVVPLH